MRTFSTSVLAILRAGALVCVVLLLSGLGLAQKVVTARATIPFTFWAQDHEFQAGDYVFDNEVPGSAAIHREGTNSGIGVSIILYAVPRERENPRVIFVRRDGKCFLFELWSVQGRYVVTAEFEHRGEASEQQRQLPLTIVESHDEWLFRTGGQQHSGRHEAGVATKDAEKPDRRTVIKGRIIGERNEYARGRAESARLNPGKV
jgi:hypothetical protein